MPIYTMFQVHFGDPPSDPKPPNPRDLFVRVEDIRDWFDLDNRPLHVWGRFGPPRWRRIEVSELDVLARAIALPQNWNFIAETLSVPRPMPGKRWARPSSGTFRFVGHIPVTLVSGDTKTSLMRLFVDCPNCGLRVSAGRIGQHVRTRNCHGRWSSDRSEAI